MPSLFDGTDQVVCRVLGIQRREQLRDPDLRLDRLSAESASRLIGDLYDRMATNYSGRARSTSKQLWRRRRATDLRDDNRNTETLLEKAVANLAESGHMPGWFNQCPVASGLTDPYADRGRRIDLVHCDGATVRFVELKWASDTPAQALFQVLEYGLAFLFAWLRKGEIELGQRYLMRVRQVGLEVVGPREFFGKGQHADLFATMSRALATFATEKTGGEVSMAMRALAFPAEFSRVPFVDGGEVKAKCRGSHLTEEGSEVREAFSAASEVTANLGRPSRGKVVTRRFLPGVPGAEIERALASAPGNEIGRRKFDHPESSAALAANAFGFFLHRAPDLPALPGCERSGWPARSVSVETTVRFPWRGGRHPVLDGVIANRSTLIGVESKRYEPFRPRNPARFSKAYWRDVWGSRMAGFESVRDALHENPHLYSHLDAPQLVKHAFALRSEVHRVGEHRRLKPILFYVYAEPTVWVRTGRSVDEDAKTRHLAEIADFGRRVEGDEVTFVHCSYSRLLANWLSAADATVRSHAQAVIERFSP